MDILSTLGNAIQSFLEVVERYAWVLVLISVFVLFSPQEILKPLGLHNLSDDNISIFGLTLIAGLAIIVSKEAKSRINQLKENTKNQKELEKSILFQLKNLNHEENEIIKLALEKDKQTCYGSISSQSYGSLVYKGFMCRGTNSSSKLHTNSSTPYTFYDDVWEILKRNFSK